MDDVETSTGAGAPLAGGVRVSVGTLLALALGHVLLPLLIIPSFHAFCGSWPVSALLLGCAVAAAVVLARAARSRTIGRAAQAVLLTLTLVLCATFVGTLLRSLILT